MNFFQTLFSASPKGYENIRGQEFMDLIQSTPDAVVIDVRTPGEFAGRRLNKAINLDIYSSSFSSAVDRLDKDKTYFIYCRSGNRSAHACHMMAQRGFTKLYNMAGGIIGI